MRLYSTALITCLPLAAVAEETADVVAITDFSVTGIIQTVLVLVIVPFVTKYLKDAAAARRAELEKSELSKKDEILEHLKIYALDRAGDYAEKDILTLSRMITTKEISRSEQVKSYLRDLGRRLKEDIIVFAKDVYGTDVIVEYGEKYVNDLVEWAANAVSPFPGKDTAQALLSGGAQRLLETGVERLDRYIEGRSSSDTDAP